MAAEMEHLSYWRANQMLARDKRIGARRRYGNNAWVERLYQAEDGSDVYGLRWHAMIVARLFSDGRVQLFTGGWRTPATARRINAVLANGGVASRRGVWYYRSGGMWGGPFREGMVVAGDGSVLFDAAVGAE